MNIASTQTLYLLTLLKLKGVGPAALKKAALIPGFEGKAIEEVASYVPAIARSLEGGARWDEAREWAEKQVEAARKYDAYILSAVDAEYPKLLAATKDDPFILYVQGKLAKPEQRSVAVIGTREPTHHGALVANRITTRFGEAGWSIVSGLAIGCDALAHQAALECGAHTVAVMAHGLHMTAPSKHKKLAQDILASGGAVVSEYPFGQAVQSQQYVKRDRTQAGLALGVVMIQSDIKGGSLYASRATLEYGRWLAVPYPTDRDRDSREPKVQANLVIAEAVPHERADLLRCTTSALERVIVLRNKEDYWKLAESSGIEPLATMPAVNRHSSDVAAPPWSAPDDSFEASNAALDETESHIPPGGHAVGDEKVDAVLEHSSASEHEPAGDSSRTEEQAPRSLESHAGLPDEVAPIFEAGASPLSETPESTAGAQDESEAFEVPAAVAVEGVIDIAVQDAVDLSEAAAPRRVLLEIKLPSGGTHGVAFGLWVPPKSGTKEFRKRLGDAMDDKAVHDFYARHRYLRTRLTELQRKLLSAKSPLKLDSVLALRLSAEEVVFQVTRVAAASAAIEQLSRAERQRVEDEDWIERSAVDGQLPASRSQATPDARRGLVEELTALLRADISSFVIGEAAQTSDDGRSDVETQQLSLEKLVEHLNAVLMSSF
jgi:DNA protecting protein DprA